MNHLPASFSPLSKRRESSRSPVRYQRSAMARVKVADRKRAIYKLLEDPQCKTVILYGEPGVGKTWTARAVCNIAKRRGLFQIVLWVYLNREYDNNDTLRDSIAQQLSLFPTYGVCEVDEDDEESKKEEVLKPEAVLKNLQKKKILLVLDDEGNKMKELEIRELLKNIFKLNLETNKVLVTTRSDPTNIGDGRKAFKVEPMVEEESLSLLKERAFSDHQVEAFSDHQVEGIDTLAKAFLPRTKCLPNAIIMMAKAFKYFSDKEGGVALLRRSLEEPSDSKIYSITDLLCSGYDLVPYSLLIDCQRDANEKPFFNDSRCINHNELIAYWMMEGYLGPVSCMETAYRKGHEILVELLDFQILKRVEADYVTINPLREEFDDFLLRRANDYYRHGYYVNARLGLDSVFDSVDWKGLVRMSHKGGVMRTLPGGKEGKKVAALLLDGNSLAKDLSSKFISSCKELQVLAIFNPTVDMLSPFSDDIIRLLHVFVLRRCWFMKNMDRVLRIENFENLSVLEISGPTESSEKEGISGSTESSKKEGISGSTVLSEKEGISCSTESSEKEGTSGLSSLYKFPDNFFERTRKLQSLNLSSLPITSLPSSLYELDELKWLILRDCTSLTTLESLRKCKKLVVLDCSGSTSMENIQDRSFSNPELQMINLSNTKMKILPLIGSLKKLTHLLLSKCPLLNRLRSINNVVSLEVIDLSNADNFIEFYDQSIEKLVNLKILDLSGTKVTTIPGNVGNPRHLCLENCSQLRGSEVLKCLAEVEDLERFVLSDASIQFIPSISHLTKLRQLSVTRCVNLEEVPDLSSLEGMQELDFSGCKSIKSIPDGTFNKMTRLQKLNLSGTSIETLPSIANLSNLYCLLLKDCKELKKLPVIESTSLEKLEELNLSGCKALTSIDSRFFDGTVNLHILDLSEAPLDKLPTFSRLLNLRELHLRNCKGVKSVPDLEALTSLQILDLSGSAVSNLPPLSNLSKLRKLLLKNCSALSLFREMRTLNVLGDSVQNLPYGISGLTSLERLHLPSMDDFVGVHSTGTNSEEADSNETKTIREKSDGCEWGISNFSAPKEKRPSISVSGTQFLQPLENDPILWESSWKKFHLSVYPIKEIDTKSASHFNGDDFVYRDIYLQSRRIVESDDQRLLEIYGFSGYKPGGIDAVFGHANQFYFVDNEFQVRKPATKGKEEELIQTLPSFLTAGNSDQIKGCWIEKCRDIEVIFSEKILDFVNSVETLWVSNAVSLKSIFGKLPEDIEVFQKLEKLYLECCPKLSTVLSLSQMPQKLKLLRIKFCDKLGKVFDLTTQKTKLQHLETLYLLELPELESIGCQLPSLKTLGISNCSKLQKLEETIRLAEMLQNLSVSNVCDLKTIGVSKELKYLSVESCPNLLKIITSSQPPNELDMRIKFCNKLETVFAEAASSEIELEKLHLYGLPKLRNIGATLPNQANRFIIDCLNCKIDA